MGWYSRSQIVFSTRIQDSSGSLPTLRWWPVSYLLNFLSPRRWNVLCHAKCATQRGTAKLDTPFFRCRHSPVPSRSSSIDHAVSPSLSAPAQLASFFYHKTTKMKRERKHATPEPMRTTRSVNLVAKGIAEKITLIADTQDLGDENNSRMLT